MNTGIRATTLIILLALSGGCASIDFDYPRTESHAFSATSDTYLGQHLTDLVTSKPADQSGFYPLPDGVDALAARLLFIERAEKSVDVQYYLIKSDLVGNTFIHVLVRAADRGVRVRLLLDDIVTAGYDTGLAALDSHPNIQVRVYNPFNRGAAGRTLGALGSFSRINRRMHNKSVTVDNQVTIIGGRNMANYYFGAEKNKKYGDLDVVGIGPVVNDVSAMFDTYWNHELAIPILGVVEPLADPDAEMQRVRETLDLTTQEVRESKYAKAVENSYYEYVHTDETIFEWAPYDLVYDSPDKSIKSEAAEAASIVTSLRESLGSAVSEVLIISPYFVPRKAGIESLLELRKKGIEVTVITNSLAANNQFAVHAGYGPSRKPLLQGGVKLYEVRPDANVAGSEFVATSGATATLHTKAFIVDRKSVFIGSFNFDPRSANLNTELGVIIHDRKLAELFTQEIVAAYPIETYEVFLNEKEKLRWRSYRSGTEVVYEKEPETTWGQRFAVGFVRILPVRGQL